MRYSWIDYAKVICIYMMVVCHAGLKGNMGTILIYQFHMPAFYIISGYLFKTKGLKNELLAFGVPLIVLGGVNLLYSFLRVFISSDFRLLDTFDAWLLVAWSSLRSLYVQSQPSLFQGCWFVIVLWMMRIFMESRFLRSSKCLVLVICLLWSCSESFWHWPELVYSLRVYHIMSAFPFFITGMILKEKNVVFLCGSIELKIGLVFLFFAITLVQGMVDLYKYMFGVNYLFFYVNALIGSFLLFNFCSRLPQRNWVEIFSIGTLLILGIHGIIFKPINDILEYCGVVNVYYAVFVGLVVMVICYYPIKWLNKKCPLLLGKIR